MTLHRKTVLYKNNSLGKRRSSVEVGMRRCCLIEVTSSCGRELAQTRKGRIWVGPARWPFWPLCREALDLTVTQADPSLQKGLPESVRCLRWGTPPWISLTFLVFA